MTLGDDSSLIGCDGIYITRFFLHQSVEAVSSVCTLYELGQALANLKNKKRFEELHLGPLCKVPLIHRMFKIDANTKDDDVHQIATVDILRVSRFGAGCELVRLR